MILLRSTCCSEDVDSESFGDVSDVDPAHELKDYRHDENTEDVVS